MASVKHWLIAFRLRTLPLALSCIIMGSFLAVSHGTFDVWIFILSIVTTMCLQILSNLANDYGDAIHGADSDIRKGPDRMVQSGAISASSMKKAILLFTALSLFFGVWLIYRGLPMGSTFYIFLALGILAIGGAVAYTVGKRPYGYMGLGDLSVFLFFGWLGVFGTYYLHMQEVNWMIFLPATSCSLFAVAVLNLNNIRDIESDQVAGKKSIPVRLGRTNAVRYHAFLLVGGLVCAAIYVCLDYRHPIQFLFLAIAPLLWINLKAVHQKVHSKDLDPYLKQMALTSLLFTLVFGIGQIMG